MGHLNPANPIALLRDALRIPWAAGILEPQYARLNVSHLRPFSVDHNMGSAGRATL